MAQRHNKPVKRNLNNLLASTTYIPVGRSNDPTTYIKNTVNDGDKRVYIENRSGQKILMGHGAPNPNTFRRDVSNPISAAQYTIETRKARAAYERSFEYAREQQADTLRRRAEHERKVKEQAESRKRFEQLKIQTAERKKREEELARQLGAQRARELGHRPEAEMQRLWAERAALWDRLSPAERLRRFGTNDPAYVNP
jgi:hypothetical protein